MFGKKYALIVFLALCLTSTLFLALATTSTTSSSEYDPWVDLNDDGVIDSTDLGMLGVAWGSTGTPINKTALLLELQSRIDSLNATVNYLISTGLDARRYDSGWFAVGKNSNYDKTHNLGTTSLIVSLWFSKTSDGSQRCYGPAPLSWREHNPECVSGVTVAEITPTMIRIRTGNDFRIPSASPGADAYDQLSSGYVRVIAIAID